MEEQREVRFYKSEEMFKNYLTALEKPHTHTNTHTHTHTHTHTQSHHGKPTTVIGGTNTMITVHRLGIGVICLNITQPVYDNPQLMVY